MKYYGLLLLPFFVTSLMTAQKQKEFSKTSTLIINNTWQENHLPESDKFNRHLDRFPKASQGTKTLENDSNTTFHSFNTMPIHKPKGNFKIRIIPADTTQKRYLKIHIPK